ncbi:MAG: SHOCT domain-containing protein [Actinobacteria bacterium]|nr:SHOCT domain-containing protein [Actinomycetota bacterium]
MFEKVTDLSIQRSGKQAFGFYLFWLLASILCLLVLGSFTDSFEAGVKLGTKFATVSCPILGYAVISQRKLMPPWSLLRVATFVGVIAALAAIGGMLLGLVPVAYLTTRARSQESQKEANEYSVSSRQTIGSGTPAFASNDIGSGGYDQQLRQLAKLKDDGIVSIEEFEQKKKALLEL